VEEAQVDEAPSPLGQPPPFPAGRDDTATHDIVVVLQSGTLGFCRAGTAPYYRREAPKGPS